MSATCRTKHPGNEVMVSSLITSPVVLRTSPVARGQPINVSSNCNVGLGRVSDKWMSDCCCLYLDVNPFLIKHGLPVAFTDTQTDRLMDERTDGWTDR